MPVRILALLLALHAHAAPAARPKAKEGNKAAADAGTIAEALEREGKVALYGLRFDAGDDKLKPESRPAADEIAKVLKKRSDLKVHVVGHTDNVGSYSANIDLSRRRAAAIVDYLTSVHGISRSRLNPQGVGPLVPVASNRGEPGRGQNRRVELVEQ